MKIWKIECCKNCPKIGHRYDMNGLFNYCHKEYKIIDDINTLPKWCPLRDYKKRKIMKKRLIIERIIERCMDCDHIYCGCCEEKRLKPIKNIYTIPKWCPLEDYNVNNNK